MHCFHWGISMSYISAIDMCQNPIEAIKILVDLGCKRVLTSGQMANAYDGRFTIETMKEAAQDKITIMPG